MFVAKVLCGNVTRGDPEYRIPPPLEGKPSTGPFYDSCVNSMENPTIYVVFDKSQCYPEYLIEYLKNPSEEEK